MTSGAALAERLKRKSDTEGWVQSSGQIHVGKDVLELLSSSMYVDPMTIYREYIQNAADSLDFAVEAGITRRDAARIEIFVDPTERTIRIRDSGAGVSAAEFVARLCSLGSSTKRGTSARGFRGVGRLAGLGYCQELIFRSRAKGEASVSEMLWNCRELKSGLRTNDPKADISSLVRSIVRVREVAASGYPSHFFEVELKGVIRHRRDRLLNQAEVQKYLAQVAPVPFAPSFRFADKIVSALEGVVELGNIEIYLNGSEKPLYRPHRNKIDLRVGDVGRIEEVEFHELKGIDGAPAGIAWIAHHDYAGALPEDGLIKGIRFRVGNVQVGDHALLEELFSEPRFNAWSIGEVHIFDKRVIPNGRRDHFEQNVHYDNILNQLGPVIRDISKRCRQSSILRKWLREFDLLTERAKSEAKNSHRRGIAGDVKARHTREAMRSLDMLKSILSNKHVDETIRAELSSRYEKTAREVEALLHRQKQSADPFAIFKPASRKPYREVIGLIYEVVPNGAMAENLVTKIFDKLTQQSSASSKPAKSKKHSRR